jgi:pimeloyl-ACP methyl ester carboxylesterase
VKARPVDKWNTPTVILYSSKDTTTEFEVVFNFANRFGCNLRVLEGGEHYFHTGEQWRVMREWLSSFIA